MAPGKYRQRPTEPKDRGKFIGSFEITVPIEGRLLQASVRPQGDNIYTTTLNNVFLAHLVKKEGVLTDYFGKTTETYQVVGKLIDEHLEKK